jgi:hypothetical protein
MAKIIEHTEVASTRVALCVKYATATRALFVCQNFDGSTFIAEQGFAPLPMNAFQAACLAAETELRNEDKGLSTPVTLERARQARQAR